MKLELKPEFLEWSINSGGRSVKRKLKNIHPSEFEKLYKEGYEEFFTLVEDRPLTTTKTTIKNEIINKTDDFNK